MPELVTSLHPTPTGHFLVDVMMQVVSTTPYGRFEHVISLIPDIERVKERIPCVPPLLKDISMHVSRCPYSVAPYFRYYLLLFSPGMTWRGKVAPG